MARVYVAIRGGSRTAHDVAEDEGILIGRIPDTRRLATLPVAKITPVPVASEHVSANHALIWATRGGLYCQDLSSRNGTWLRIPRSEVVQLRAMEVSLDLAHAAGSLPAPALSALAADWSSDKDFGPALRDAVRTWADEQGMDLSVDLLAMDAPVKGTGLALATGQHLVIASPSLATTDLRHGLQLETIAAFVEQQNAKFDEDQGHANDLVLVSAGIRAAHSKVYDAAARGRRLLLLGPSGVGKERLAECFHRHSRRAEGPFKAVNCALIARDMVWVQLFGAARGSYTGAVRDVAGAVEAAHGGTLFLDEIGELSQEVQGALLRFLDRHGEYERLGDPRTYHSDLQVVCATNRDLRAAIARGEFREDLWYRFASYVVEVPALRDRPEDVLDFLARRQVTRDLDARSALSPEALKCLLDYAWPGNFRELENLVLRLPAVSSPGAIDLATVERALLEGSVLTSTRGRDGAPPGPSPRPDWQDLFLRATEAWQVDHEGTSPGYGQLRDFVEAYWKPVVMGASCADLTPGQSVNYSAIGRRLDIADGTTVRKYLERYFSRFKR